MPDETKGDCYQANIRFLREQVDRAELADWRLCHGTVTNSLGQDIGHCWLESNGFAYDFSNGNAVRLEVDEFRRITRARDISVYTSEEISVNIIRQGHNGPWT